MPSLGDLGGEVAHEAVDIGFAQERRHLAHGDRAGAEGFEHEAELGELVCLFGECVGLVAVHFDDCRDEQPLPRDAAVGEHRLHALVDEALVRRVLVDDDDRVARLRDDVGLVQLRARGAERAVLQLGGGRRVVGARVGAGRVEGLERGLHGFGEAGARRGQTRLDGGQTSGSDTLRGARDGSHAGGRASP